MSKTTIHGSVLKFLAVGALLVAGNWGSAHAATSVAAGSNLITSLNTATATDYEFNLLGDVSFGSTFAMNGTNAKKILIDGLYADGQRAVITRTTAGNRFTVGTAGNELTITNAVVTAGAATSGNGAVYISATTSTLNFNNTVFSGNNSVNGLGVGGALSAQSNTNTVVNGNVTFLNNTGTGDAGGAVGTYGAGEASRAIMTFTGVTAFEGNSTVNYGGAISVSYWSSVVFENAASFKNNYATAYFGGAIDLYGGRSFATFKSDAVFEGNYVKNTAAPGHGYGARGGAVHVGYIAGTTTVDVPQLDFQGTATFSNNYVWGMGATKGYGGALAIASAAGDPENVGATGGSVYAANINRGIFNDNYAYSVNGNAYGGAIYVKSLQASLTLGSGSSFSNNYAKTLGGAIFFDQGTLNLNGNVTFQGNRHGVTFDTSNNQLTYVEGTGTANAIYFGVSSNTATLNLNTAAGEQISFHDPITAASGKTVSVNKTGDGVVAFSENDSALLAQTMVSGGTFKLVNGASYGLVGTTANSTFTVAVGATLHGGAGSTLNASLFSMAGTLAMDAGTFTVNTSGNVTLTSSTVLDIIINSVDSHSLLQVTGGAVELGNAKVSLNLDNAFLSIGDEIKIIESSISVSGLLSDGDVISADGYEFSVGYNAADVTLTVMAVPEPSTYALLGTFGLVGLVVLRRRKQ